MKKNNICNRVSVVTIDLNKGKSETLASFFVDSKDFVQQVINHIWYQGVGDFNPSLKQFTSTPKFLDSSFLETFNTTGIGGMMKQTLGMIALQQVKSVTEKLRKKQWFISKIQQKRNKGEVLKEFEKKKLHELYKDVNTNTLPPVLTNFSIPISRPDVVRFFTVNKQGDEFSKGNVVLRLSLSGNYGTISIPVVRTKQTNKLLQNGFVQKLSTTTLYSSDKIGLIFQSEKAPFKEEGRVVGADQGISSVLTFSDKQVTKNTNNHNQSLSSILKKLSGKKKGSKSFEKTQDHRKNFINWSINQLNFKDVKTVRLEHLKNVGKGHRTSRFLSSWTYPLIKQKLVSLSELEGFQIEEVPNKFRSQRCNCCGYVNKKNRKGKTFKCRSCDHIADADENAASNLELCLFKIPFWVFEERLNREGFFWNEEGIFLEEPVISSDKKLDIFITNV